MKKSVLYLLLFALCLNVSAKDKDEFKYEVVPVAVGTEGTALIKVYSYARTQKKAIELGKKNAIHAILFKGVPGGNGVYAQPPIVKPDIKETNQKFFDDFFDKGDYLRYVTVSTDGIIDPHDMLRVGRQYKIGIIFVVNKNELRKYLESEHIIQSIGSMF